MMKKVNSNKLSVVKLILIIPIIIAGVYFVSCKNSDNLKSDSNISELKVVKGQKIDSSAVLLPPPPPPPPAPNERNKDVYESFAIDSKPEFPGGDTALIAYVAQHIKYPAEAKKKGIQGTVYIRFVVTKTGDVGKTMVMRALNPLLEEEAIRVVQSLPRWKPGMIKGNPVDVYFVIPIKFKLN